MKKKMILTLLTALMVSTLLAGCGAGESSSSDKSDSGSKSSGDAIRIVNGKIEIDKALKAYAKDYEERTGQEVVIESLGGGADIQGTLKSYKASENMPDLFVIGGKGDFANWEDYVADLGDCKWASETDFAFKDDSGKVVGFPYAVEGYGITYNADILKEAGVDPASLTNYDAFKNAFETIDSKKDELGLSAVCSIAAESGQMYWSTGNHLFGYYLSGGLERDDNQYFDEMMEGKLDTDRADQFADFFKLLCDYSDKQVLVSGTYDDQLALFAQGKSAFITQGNWIDPSLPDYDATFDCGIAPLAFTQEDMTSVLADSPSWWCAYKDGKNLDAVKAFLDDLALSEEGQKCLITDCGMISPYNNSGIKPEASLAKSLQSYVSEGRTSSWAWSNMPEGIAQKATGVVFESYAKGDVDKDTFVKTLQSSIADYVAQSQQ